MSACKFTINVAVTHPTWCNEKIAAGFAWAPYNAWSVGDRRVTPVGIELPGFRNSTMCSFVFNRYDDQVTSAVTETVENLLMRRIFIDELIISGGEVALNIRLNGAFNSNLDMPPAILSDIGSLGMRLSVEIFPDG